MTGDNYEEQLSCFLCGDSSNLGKKSKSCSWPSNNLDVIFLLRNLLLVPKSILVNHLKKCEANPDRWINLCGLCIRLIGSARALDLEIQKLEKEWRSIQVQVLDKLRTSTDDKQKSKAECHNDKDTFGISFQEKVKLLVKKNKHLSSKEDGNDDLGHLEGDQLAKRLAIQEGPSKSISFVEETETAPEDIKVKVEEDEPKPPLSPEADPISKSPSPPPEVPCSSLEKSLGTTQVSIEAPASTEINPDSGATKRFHCSECGKGFFHARFWAEHLLNFHNIREITCPAEKCSEKFNDDLVTFQNHWKANHLTWSGRKRPCLQCGKEFKNIHSLCNHRRDQHFTNNPKKQPFICDICGVEKNTYPAWYHHRKSKHQISGKSGEISKSKPRPRRRTKENMKSQLCQLCGKSLKGNETLKKHLKNVHEKRFNFSCHVCGVTKPVSRDLKFHLLSMHKDDPVTRKLEEEGIRLWKCEVAGCRHKFLKKNELDKHRERFHTGGEDGEGEKRYKCRYCGKGFWNGQMLRGHEEAHEGKGKEDWKCEVCGKGFGTRINLRAHLKHVHKLMGTKGEDN